MKNIRKFNPYLAIILSCVAVFLFPKLNALYVFFLIVGLVIAFLKKYADPKDARFFTIMIILIVATRLFLALLVMEARGEALTQDEGLYSKKAIIKAYEIKGVRNFTENFAVFFDNDYDVLNKAYGYNAYTYMLSLFYYLFGYQIQAARLINIFIFMITFLFIFFTARELFDRKVAALSSVVFAFFPSIMLWSVAVGVDTTVLFCISAYMFSLIRVIKRFGFGWLLMMAVSFFALKTFRGYAASCLLVTTFVAIIPVLFKKLTRKVRRVSIFLIIAAIFVIIGAPFRSVIETKLQENVKTVIELQGGFASIDEGGYLTFPDHCYEDYKCSFIEFIQAYAKGMLHVLFSPFPWKIGSKLQLMAYPQILLWYCMIPFIVYGFYKGFKKTGLYAFIIFLYCFLLFSVLALAEGNLGGLFRHRDMAILFTLIFFAVGVFDLADRYYKKNQLRKA